MIIFTCLKLFNPTEENKKAIQDTKNNISDKVQKENIKENQKIVFDEDF